ncbi:hypothetical protein GCM10010177_48330 [Actinomadura citrea]|nr:hypothetical protein GCM10010177_48330 [Actinomadura citrea]
MPAIDQKGHQEGTDGPGGTGDKDMHSEILPMTRNSAEMAAAWVPPP